MISIEFFWYTFLCISWGFTTGILAGLAYKEAKQ